MTRLTRDADFLAQLGTAGENLDVAADTPNCVERPFCRTIQRISRHLGYVPWSDYQPQIQADVNGALARLEKLELIQQPEKNPR